MTNDKREIQRKSCNLPKRPSSQKNQQSIPHVGDANPHQLTND